MQAAEHHESAAKSHRTAAEHHGNNDQVAAQMHSGEAHGHSTKAHEASKNAQTTKTSAKYRALCDSAPCPDQVIVGRVLITSMNLTKHLLQNYKPAGT